MYAASEIRDVTNIWDATSENQDVTEIRGRHKVGAASQIWDVTRWARGGDSRASRAVEAVEAVEAVDSIAFKFIWY